MPTLDYTVPAGASDGEWFGSTFVGTNAAIRTGDFLGRDYKDFFQFTGVTIPVGATIDVAYLTFQAAATEAGAAVNLTIAADDQVNPGAVISAADGNGRTLTTATVAWSSVTDMTANSDYNSPELKTIIQELVDSYDYSAGSALQLFLINNGSTNQEYRQLKGYESSDAVCARLHIEYTAGGSTNWLPRVARHFTIPALGGRYG